MNAPDSVPLPTNVLPDQTVDISVNLSAPEAAGEYQGFWQLQSADGKNFGFGVSGIGRIWVKVKVIAPAFNGVTPTPAAPTGIPSFTSTPVLQATPTNQGQVNTLDITDDFAGNACAAQWQSNNGTLPCPGLAGDPQGFVISMDQANLEDGSTAALPTLLTFPQSSPNGYILGIYPEYQVEAGDHLQAAVGCEQNATTCSVLFRISYLDASSAAHDLWTLGEFYDGKYFNLDLDLSQFAGQKIRFVLSVNGLGNSTGDRALWVAPRIVHFTVATPTAGATLSPSSTPSPTATAAPSQTPVPTVALTPTPAAGNPNPAPAIQQIVESIISFFRRLVGGK